MRAILTIIFVILGAFYICDKLDKREFNAYPMKSHLLIVHDIDDTMIWLTDGNRECGRVKKIDTGVLSEDVITRDKVYPSDQGITPLGFIFTEQSIWEGYVDFPENPFDKSQPLYYPIPRKIFKLQADAIAYVANFCKVE